MMRTNAFPQSSKRVSTQGASSPCSSYATWNVVSAIQAVSLKQPCSISCDKTRHYVSAECLLLAQSRHDVVRKSAFAVAIGVKRTCLCALHMSAYDPKRTFMRWDHLRSDKKVARR